MYPSKELATLRKAHPEAAQYITDTFGSDYMFSEAEKYERWIMQAYIAAKDKYQGK